VTCWFQAGRAALALAWIGGQEAKEAIEHAIQIERDDLKRKELEDALTEFNRRWRDQSETKESRRNGNAPEGDGSGIRSSICDFESRRLRPVRRQN
jgi:hypothetical protein